MNGTFFHGSLWQRCSPVLWTGLSVFLWKWPSTGLHDAVVYGALVCALILRFRTGQGAGIWRAPAGRAFGLVLLFTALSLVWAADRMDSARDLIKNLDLAAGAVALAILFPTPGRMASALGYAALGLALILGYDTLRLVWHLKAQVLAKAHTFEPFILNHSNVASMMAGLACLMLFYWFWKWRRRFWPAAACGVGLALMLAYQVIAGSRGPQLAFALTCVCGGLLIPGHWRRKLKWIGLAAAAGAVILFFFSPRLREMQSLRNFSERTTVWRHTWECARQKPWLGHGYGKKTFVAVYYGSQPPKATFTFPHAHQYWLKLLFECGWLGVLLYLAAWLLLAVQLLRAIFSRATFEDRVLPGMVALCLLMIHVYGLGDFPDHVVMTAQYWLIPAALVVCRTETEEQRRF